MLRSTHLDLVRRDLQNLKDHLNLGKELKWVRVSEQYEQKYLEFLKTFFNLVEQDIIKVRVMFTQNIHVPILTKAQIDKSYFLLYYQFIKLAFGLRYSNPTQQEINVRVYPDYIPHTKENTEQFIGAVNAAFQDREEALNAVRVNIAPDVFFGGMNDRLMRGEPPAEPTIDLQFVRM